MKPKLNKEVTDFLDGLKHPFRKEIEAARVIILVAEPGLDENIKWNGPNYSLGENDRITMRIQPPRQLQLIFHRGAKSVAQPKGKLIDDNSGLLEWKSNDRAVITFRSMDEVKSASKSLTEIVRKWIKASA